MAEAHVSAAGNLKVQVIVDLKEPFLVQVPAALDRYAFDRGDGYVDTEDELGIVAVLQLELQGSVLDDRQDLVGELLRGFDAHFLPRGLTEVHIAGEAGREGAERADFADLDKVDALLGAVADNGGAIETDNAGCDQEAADQDQEKFHR